VKILLYILIGATAATAAVAAVLAVQSRDEISRYREINRM
jgi:hypothetical protein